MEWRFISLRQLNAHVDYDAQFPPEYEAGQTAGLRLLRVAARVRSENGQAAVASFYEACGARVFDSDPPESALDNQGQRGTVGFVEPVLAAAGLPPPNSPRRWTTTPGTLRSGSRPTRVAFYPSVDVREVR